MEQKLVTSRETNLRPVGPGYIAVSEAARLAGVTPSTIRRWIKRGRLLAVKTSSGWRIARDGVAAAQDTAGADDRNRQAELKPTQHDLAAEVARLTEENDQLRRELHDVKRERERLAAQLRIARQAAMASASTPDSDEPRVDRTAHLPVPTADRGELSEQSYRKLLEGMQRTIVFEESRRKRAVRRRDHETARAAERRLAELNAQLAAVRSEYQATQPKPEPGELATSAVAAAVARVNIARPTLALSAPRRMVSVTALMFLNAALMMIANLFV